MLDEFLQDQAALYATGGMTAAQREEFELVLEFHQELRALVTGLLEAGTALTLAQPRAGKPSLQLKRRIMDHIDTHADRAKPEGVVMSGPDGLVQWVNPAFTEMCGYSLEELRGRKLGPLLQGVDTDRETANRMRSALKEYRPCRETILNYHKDGSPYWVEISIRPILDQAGQPLWLVAQEREVTGPVAA